MRRFTIQPKNFLQDMDSEINSIVLNEMLEEDFISLSGGESDTDLLQSDFGRNAKEDQITRPYSIIDELMDGPPTHQTQHQHTSVTAPSALTSPPLPKASPPPTIPHQSSTTTPKPTSSNQTISTSKHLRFNFYFIPNHPNYISKLNLPTNLAKLCTDIQRNAELSIINLVENYLTKRHKQKKKNKNKNNNTGSTTRIKYKPRFTPKEHKLISPTTTSPIHTSPPTYTTTATQTTPPGFDQHTPITTTHYTQPTRKNHISTCNKPQSLPHYASTFHHHPNTHHASKRTYTHVPLTNYHSSKHRSPLPTAHTATHRQHQISPQSTHITHTYPTHSITSTEANKLSHAYQKHYHTLTHHTDNKTQGDTSHLTTSNSYRKSPHVFRQYSHMHHTNNNNQQTKTTPSNIKQQPQQTSHNLTNILTPQHTTTSIPNIATLPQPTPQSFHTQINPAMMHLLIQHSNRTSQKK